MQANMVLADSGRHRFGEAVREALRVLPTKYGMNATKRMIAEVTRAVRPGGWGDRPYLTEGEGAIALRSLMDGTSAWLILTRESMVNGIAPDLLRSRAVAQVAHAAAQRALGGRAHDDGHVPDLPNVLGATDSLGEALWARVVALLLNLDVPEAPNSPLEADLLRLRQEWESQPTPPESPPELPAPLDRDTEALVAAARPGPLAGVMLAAA